MKVTALQPIHQQNFAQAPALVLQAHSEPSHQRSGDERILRQLQFLDDVLRQGGPLNAVRGERVITENRWAVRHHKSSRDSCLDFSPDALVKIAVQRFVATTEVQTVVLRAEGFDWKVEQRPYRPADALSFRNRLQASWSFWFGAGGSISAPMKTFCCS